MADKNNNNKNNRNPGANKKTLSQKFFSKISGYDKEGKGVKKRKISDKERFSLKSFFAVYKDQFWNLIIVNLIFMLMVSPVICGLMNVLGVFYTRVPTPSNIIYASVYGMHLYNPTSATAGLIGIYGVQAVNLVENSVTVVLNYLTLIVFITFGLANAGMTYILRAYTKGEPVYLWSDFFRTIKKNFLGAVLLGIADLAVIILVVYSSFYYYTAALDFSYTILFFITFSMGVIYFIMRFYIYILLITFKLSPLKLIKNSFILALLGIKRNIMAILGILTLCGLIVIVFILFNPIGMILPFFFLIANGGFMACFAAYPNVKKFMIDPYYEENPDKKDEKFVIEEEPIFIDRG